MKVLWISERFPPDIGGVARSAGRLTQSLTALGVEVDVVTWSRYLEMGTVVPEQVASTGEAKLNVYRLGLCRNWDMTLPHTLNLLDWLHGQANYDAVWGHYLFPAGFVAAWFAKLNGIASVVSARGNDVDRGIFPPGDFSRLQWTLSNATVVTSVSQEIERKIETLSQQTVSVLPNVVDSSIFHPLAEIFQNGAATESSDLREKLGIAPDEVVLGFSGELREKKGQRFLLRALSEVRSNRPACLLIIGELRPESQTLLQTYAQTAPEDAARVIVTGHLEQPKQVAQHLRLCDVYLQPSVWDGMPNALLEAMACGVVCIGSDAGGIAEVITHRETGFLLPRAQLHRLGSAVLEFLSLEAAVKQKISQQAIAHIHTHHTLEQERSQLQQILTTLKPASSL